MRNVTSMLQPGGTFIIHALHQCKAYKCGDRMFPGSNLSIDDMRDAMLENGFAPSSIDAQVIPCPDNCDVRILGHSHRVGPQGRRAAEAALRLPTTVAGPARPGRRRPARTSRAAARRPAYQRVARIE